MEQPTRTTVLFQYVPMVRAISMTMDRVRMAVNADSCRGSHTKYPCYDSCRLGMVVSPATIQRGNHFMAPIIGTRTLALSCDAFLLVVLNVVVIPLVSRAACLESLLESTYDSGQNGTPLLLDCRGGTISAVCCTTTPEEAYQLCRVYSANSRKTH
jgi:hypothetical protein